ncbi:MAG: ABC transporter substrate-binding protein [Sediminibacterium sp.]|nr:ABC transporter substrate-binding protein [Sediminibacterium sp.]
MTTNKEHSGFWDTLHKIYIVIAVFVTPVLALTKHFFHFPSFEYFDLSIIALVLLSVGCVFFFISSRVKAGSEPPFYLKKWFLTIYKLLTLSAFGNLLFLIGGIYNPSKDCPQSKTRIIIMLPLGDVIKPAYQDGMRQMYGYAEFLNDYNTRYTEDFEFVPVDHSMNYDVAKQIIEAEVNRGTKYFICTMSKVNQELSLHFEEIISRCHFIGEKPILICTVTSSPKIILKPNLIYRFYVRSQEEGKCLAELANNKKLNSATYIVVNDPYGKGAVEEFRKNWNGRFTEGVKVDFGTGVDEISEQISNQFNSIPEGDRQVIFIAHYGNGIDNIIKALDRTHTKGVILATSTLSISDWQEPIKNILANYQWYTCVPKYLSVDKNQDDVIKNFTTHTLKRLVQTINLQKGNPTSTFDENWKKAEVYTNLDITWDTNGDAIVPMKAVDKTYFK